MTEQDLKEAAKIERKRKLEEERRKRIFNARNRVIGVDFETLNKQIIEKNNIRNEEQRRDEIFDKQLEHTVRMGYELEQREIAERVKINKEIEGFRKTHQRPEDRREFDLNDPNILKKSVPMRTEGDEARCGISCAQKFEGEDLTSKARAQLQREQTKSWLEQQINEQIAANNDRKMAEDAYQMAVLARDERATELQRLEDECRKKLNEAVVDYNHALANEIKTRNDMKHREEQEDNYAEMYNAATGDFLTENKDVATSNFGPNRVIGYMYKGMNPVEREAVRREQLKQIEQNKIDRMNQLALDKQRDEYTNYVARQANMAYSELEKKQRELTLRMAADNAQLCREQKARKEYFDRAVYTNQPTAAFFEQFNTTSR